MCLLTCARRAHTHEPVAYWPCVALDHSPLPSTPRTALSCPASPRPCCPHHSTPPQDPTGLGYVLPQPLEPSPAAPDPTLHLHPHEAAPTATAASARPAAPLPPTSGWGTVILLPAAPRLLQPPPQDGAATAAVSGASWKSLAAGLVSQVGGGNWATLLTRYPTF